MKHLTIRAKTAALLIGPPFSGKHKVLGKILGSRLTEPTVFISTDEPPDEIVEKFGLHGANGNISFIDCYSRQVAENISDTRSIIRVPGPAALTEISKSVSDFCNKLKKPLYIFDSLSTVLIYSDMTMLSRFLQLLISKVKNNNASIIFTVEQGMHEGKDTALLMHLVDTVIETKRHGNDVLCRVIDGTGTQESWTGLR
jgi:KaiC/GvpD/RAD55 family RecA-like ATPase